MSRALAFAKGISIRTTSSIPTFYFYVLFAGRGLSALLGGDRSRQSLSAFQQEFFVDPTRVYTAAPVDGVVRHGDGSATYAFAQAGQRWTPASVPLPSWRSLHCTCATRTTSNTTSRSRY